MKSSWLNCLSCGGLYGKKEKKKKSADLNFSNHQFPPHSNYTSLPSRVICISAKALGLPHNVPGERKGKVVCITSIKDIQSTCVFTYCLWPQHFPFSMLVQGGVVHIYHMRRQEGAYLIQIVFPNSRTLSQQSSRRTRGKEGQETNVHTEYLYPELQPLVNNLPFLLEQSTGTFISWVIPNSNHTSYQVFRRDFLSPSLKHLS